jgi:hypothetical protein
VKQEKVKADRRNRCMGIQIKELHKSHMGFNIAIVTVVRELKD